MFLSPKMVACRNRHQLYECLLETFPKNGYFELFSIRISYLYIKKERVT